MPALCAVPTSTPKEKLRSLHYPGSGTLSCTRGLRAPPVGVGLRLGVLVPPAACQLPNLLLLEVPPSGQGANAWRPADLHPLVVQLKQVGQVLGRIISDRPRTQRFPNFAGEVGCDAQSVPATAPAGGRSKPVLMHPLLVRRLGVP